MKRQHICKRALAGRLQVVDVGQRCLSIHSSVIPLLAGGVEQPYKRLISQRSTRAALFKFPTLLNHVFFVTSS